MIRAVIDPSVLVSARIRAYGERHYVALGYSWKGYTRSDADTASILVALGVDPGSVMDQLGHADPGFTLRVYRHAMRRDPAAKARLRTLVGGADWATIGNSEAQPPWSELAATGRPGLGSVR